MNDELSASPQPTPLNPIQQIFRDLIDCLTEPRQFFTVRYPQITFNYALAFGIVVNWIAAFLAWLTRVVRHETLLDGLLKMRDQLQGLPFWKALPKSIWAQNPEQTSMFPAWLAEVFSLALNPFGTLIHFFIYGVMIWIGASLLISKRDDRDSITIPNLVKIVALASVPQLIGAILGFLPLGLGGLIAGVYGFALLVLAISIRYSVSYLRSFAAVVLPGLIGMLIFGCILAVFTALIFGTIAALFQVQ